MLSRCEVKTRVFSQNGTLSIAHPSVESKDVEKQCRIDDEQHSGGNGSVQRCSCVMAEHCVHAARQQPKLHNNSDTNQSEQRTEERCSLPLRIHLNLYSHGKDVITALFQSDSRQRTGRGTCCGTSFFDAEIAVMTWTEQ